MGLPIGEGTLAYDAAELLVEVLRVGDAGLLADFRHGQIAGEQEVAGELDAAEEDVVLELHAVSLGEEAGDVVGAEAGLFGEVADEEGLVEGGVDGLVEFDEAFFHEAGAAGGLLPAADLAVEPEEEFLERGGGGAGGGRVSLATSLAGMVDGAPEAFAEGGGLRAEADMEREAYGGTGHRGGGRVEVDAEVGAALEEGVTGGDVGRGEGEVAGLEGVALAGDPEVALVVVEVEGDGGALVGPVAAGDGHGEGAGVAEGGEVVGGPVEAEGEREHF